jgi:ABC-type transport system involved in multi-copper enzyme maturation permease subunit
MSIFIGSTLLSKEIESRTLYMILSRPLSRISFMLGKVLGLSSVLVINTIILCLVAIGIYFYLGGKINPLMFWAGLFSMFEAFIIMLFSIMFSLLTSNALAIICTIAVWIVGHSLSATSRILFIKSNAFMSCVLKAIAYLVPDLEKINLKDLLIYEQTISSDFLIKANIYALLYILGLLLIISFLFKKKNLD